MGCQATSGWSQSEARPAGPFWGAFDISAVTALLKNLGGGVEAAPRLSRLVQFITPWCLYSRLSFSPDTESEVLTPRHRL